MRVKLGEQCGAPLQEIVHKTREDFELKAVRSAGRALFKDRKLQKIPSKRRDELLQILKDFFDKAEIFDEDIDKAADTDVYLENENYVSHAAIVVEYFKENEGILKLEKIWRTHFLEQMEPKFLPPNWSVDHQEDRLSIRKDENRIDSADLEIAVGTNGDLN